MATTTPNLGFTLPATTDAALISVINTNFTLADAAITLTNTQTLTNKTLTAPHLTTPVVDSGGLTITAGGATITAGGLTVTAGGVGIGAAPQTNAGLNVGATAATDGTNRYNAFVNQPSGATNNNVGLVVGSAPAVQITGSIFAGSGDSFFGTGGIGTTATTGFLYMPQGSGTPTGIPSYQNKGWAPFQFDQTASKLWIYHAGVGWQGVVVS